MDQTTLVILAALGGTILIFGGIAVLRMLAQERPELGMVIQTARHFAGDLIEGVIAATSDSSELDSDQVVEYVMQRVGPMVDSKHQEALLEALVRADVERLLEYLSRTADPNLVDPQVTEDPGAMDKLIRQLGLEGLEEQ